MGVKAVGTKISQCKQTKWHWQTERSTGKTNCGVMSRMGAEPTAAGRKNNLQGGCIYPPSNYVEKDQQLQYQYEKTTSMCNYVFILVYQSNSYICYCHLLARVDNV